MFVMTVLVFLTCFMCGLEEQLSRTCHKFFNDCVKVVQNSLVRFQDGASFLCNQDTYMLVPSHQEQLLT